jgi:hypothetical protein
MLQQSAMVGAQEQGQKEEGQKEEGRFYIYDWPSLDGLSSWPLPDETLVGGKAFTLDFKHVHSMNYGAGEEVNASLGLFSTNPYHLYELIISRLRVHPLRVMDKESASLFIVPYDIGVVSQWDPHTGTYRLHQVNGCRAVDEVSALLSTAVAASPLQGHDHVVINSMFGVMNFNCYKILTMCPNCARLSSEPSRSMYPLQYNLPSAFYKYAKKRNVTIPYGTFGVPIPASVHYNEEMKQYPWSAWEGERAILVSGWFALFVQNKAATWLRNQVYKHCAEHFDKCAFVEISERSGHQARTVPLRKRGYSKVKSATANNDNLTKTFESGYDFYRHSTFCLHPPGDMEMRKGMFDSMLLGCIPVLFLPDILTRKYPWYFNKETEAAVTVNVKLSLVSNIVTYLEAIPPEVIRQKRKALAEMAASLSYALPPLALRSAVGFGSKKGARDGETTWQPPFRDATDVMLTALFQRVRRYKATGGIIPEEEKAIKKSDFDLYWV